MFEILHNDYISFPRDNANIDHSKVPAGHDGTCRHDAKREKGLDKLVTLEEFKTK